MRHEKHLRESLALLYTKLMATPEAQWVVITKTKGKNKKGQQWLLDQLTKMCRLAEVDVYTESEPQFQIMRVNLQTFAQSFGYANRAGKPNLQSLYYKHALQLYRNQRKSP